jgi:hypothetical protein
MAYGLGLSSTAMTGRRTLLAVLGMGLLGSQAGHLLAYQLRFGAAAQQVQSSGAHAYFPVVARTSLGIVATALLFSVFVIGLARVLAGRSSARTSSPPSYLGMLAILFTVQLGCFAGQEVAEALVAQARVGSAADLLLWGALGQLPVAVIAATALRWVLTRFETAVAEIQSALAVLQASPVPVAVAIPVWSSTGRALLLSGVAGASLGKRGPPLSFPIKSR